MRLSEFGQYESRSRIGAISIAANDNCANGEFGFRSRLGGSSTSTIARPRR